MEGEVNGGLNCQLRAFLMEMSVIIPGAAQHTFEDSPQSVAQTNQLNLPSDDSTAQYLNLEQIEEDNQTFDEPDVQPYFKSTDELSSQARFEGLRDATSPASSIDAKTQGHNSSQSHPGPAQSPGEMHVDFMLNNRQGRGGPSGLQLDSSIRFNVIPSSQHFSAHVPEKYSRSLQPVVDFSHANFRLENTPETVICPIVPMRHSICSNTSKAKHVATGAAPVFDEPKVQPYVGISSGAWIEGVTDAIVPASSIETQGQDEHSSQSHPGPAKSQCGKRADFRLNGRHGTGGTYGFQVDSSSRCNAVPSSQQFLAPVFEDSRSLQPILVFDVFHSNLRQENAPPMILFPSLPMWDSNCTNRSKAIGVSSGAAPVFLSECSGSLAPPSLIPVRPQQSAVSPHCSSTPTFLSHLPYPKDTTKRPRLETEVLALPGKHVRQTVSESDTVNWHATKRYREQPKIDPDVVRTAKPKGSIHPFEKEMTKICTKMMGSVTVQEVDGLADKLARIIFNHQTCRDERRPIHIERNCAFVTDSTTAVECCWSKEFGSIGFPDEKRIMESFQQVCTRLVNEELEERRKSKGGRGVCNFPDFVNEKLEEFFQSYGPFRKSCPIKHDAQKVLAKKLGLRVKQVQNKMRSLQRIKDKEGKSKDFALTRVGPAQRE